MSLFTGFKGHTARKNVTEKQAIERLIMEADELVHRAVWSSLSMKVKIGELRAPLAELKMARRKTNGQAHTDSHEQSQEG